MKKNIIGSFTRSLWIYLIIGALIISIGYIAAILAESNRLRKFKVDTFVLCNESSVCIADGPDGLVRVNSENLRALYSLIEKAHGSVTICRPDAEETTSFEFSCHDSEWDLVVEKINDKKLRITLDGERDYSLYVKNGNLYDSFRKAASVESFNVNNKKMNASK